MPQQSIVELQRALEDFADNSLAQEAQNPSGIYPLYLVIAEIQRRTDMRERFAANEQMASLSLPSIAEQKVAGLGGVISVDPSVNQGSNLSPEVMNQGVGSLNQVGVDPNDTQQLASLPPGVMGQQIGPSPVGMQQQFGQGVGDFSQPQPVSMAHGGIVDLPGRLPEQEYDPQEKPLTREERLRRERMNAAWRRRLFQVMGIDVPESLFPFMPPEGPYPADPSMDSIPGLTEDIGVSGPFPFMPSDDPFGGGPPYPSLMDPESRGLLEALGIEDMPAMAQLPKYLTPTDSQIPSAPFMDSIPGLTDTGFSRPFRVKRLQDRQIPPLPAQLEETTQRLQEPYDSLRAEIDRYSEHYGVDPSSDIVESALAGVAEQISPDAMRLNPQRDDETYASYIARVARSGLSSSEGARGGFYGSYVAPPPVPAMSQEERAALLEEAAGQSEMDQLFETFGIDPNFDLPEISPFGDIPDFAFDVGSDFDERIRAIRVEEEEALRGASEVDKKSLEAFRIGAESKEKNARRMAELYKGRTEEGETAYETSLRGMRMSPEARARENKAHMLSGIADTLGTATQAGDIATGLGGVTRGLIDFKRIGREEDIRVLGELGRLEEARKDRVFDATRNMLEQEGVASDQSHSVAVYIAEQEQRAFQLAQQYSQLRTAAAEAKLSAVSAARGVGYQVESDRALKYAELEAARDRAKYMADSQLKQALGNVMARINAEGGDGASWGSWTSVMSNTMAQIREVTDRLKQPFFYDLGDGTFTREADQRHLIFLNERLQQSEIYWREMQTGGEIDPEGHWPTLPNGNPLLTPTPGSQNDEAANLTGLDLGESDLFEDIRLEYSGGRQTQGPGR